MMLFRRGVFQSCLPVLRSKATTDCTCGDDSDVARKIWSPTMIGDACPRPGTGDFQTTFSLSPNFVGTDCSAAIPLREGPRHHGQSRSADSFGKSAIPRSVSPARPTIASGSSVTQMIAHQMRRLDAGMS